MKAIEPLDAWFVARGWTAFPFQREVWRAMVRGHSGVLHATTGAGKTYAVWLGALAAFAVPRGASGGDLTSRKAASATSAVTAPSKTDAQRKRQRAQAAAPLTALWLTPMRALAADTVAALSEPLNELAPHWTLGLRTGDTPSA
ncbi:MAG: DEAD/DEAH box helicase, partial [Comamonadaceae bacterium]